MAVKYVNSSSSAVWASGAAHWVALIHNGANAITVVLDGAVLDTVYANMRMFDGASLVDLFSGIADVPYVGRPSDGTGYTGITDVDVKRERAWNYPLSLAQVTAEAASTTPILTSGLISNTGLTSTSDLSGTVGSHSFTTTNPYFTSTPGNSGDGYVRFSDFTDGIRRDGTFLSVSGPFTLLWHSRITGTASAPSDVIDLRLLAHDSDFTAPYLWFGLVGGAALIEIAYQDIVTPIDTSIECCETVPAGGTNAGDVKRPADPAWTPSCTGGGAVATASDLTVSEDWSA